MRAIFDEPLRVTPVDSSEGRRFQIEATPDVGKMLAFDLAPPTCCPDEDQTECPRPQVEFSKSASPAGHRQIGTWKIPRFLMPCSRGPIGVPTRLKVASTPFKLRREAARPAKGMAAVSRERGFERW
jgi:hypothetical protein